MWDNAVESQTTNEQIVENQIAKNQMISSFSRKAKFWVSWAE
jgi:hypothetical protein